MSTNLKIASPGFNVTVLAYGQTGSGKTHSMGTCCNQLTPLEMEGVIPRAIREIFGKIASMSDYDFSVRIAFIELYNEQLYDLLSTQVSSLSFLLAWISLKKIDLLRFVVQTKIRAVYSVYFYFPSNEEAPGFCSVLFVLI